MTADTPSDADTPASAGYGRSADGLVELTVGADGMPIRLSIQQAAMRLTADALTERVLTAMRLAHEDAQAQAMERFDREPLDPHAPGLQTTIETTHRIRADLEAKAADVDEQLADVRRALNIVLGDLHR
jgi:DNA-binding protein YbaB